MIVLGSRTQIVGHWNKKSFGRRRRWSHQCIIGAACLSWRLHSVLRITHRICR
jgi:hypothetical protein